MLSLMLVAVGAALAAGGPTVLLAVVSFGWRNASALLFVLGGVALLSAVVPPGTLAGPMVFGLLGLGVVLVRSGFSDTIGRFGVAAALVGVGLVLATEPGPRRALELRRRRWAVLFPRRAPVSSVPPRVRLVAVGNRFTLDLSEARCQRTVVEFFLSSWCGHVTLVLPTNWAVVAGRVTAARGIRLEGNLDSTRTFEDPDDDVLGKELDNLLTQRGSIPARRCVVVIHLLGVGGCVSVRRVSS